MRLCDCFIDLIAYVTYLRKNNAISTMTEDEVRLEIVKRIERSMLLFEENSFLHDDYDLARFAVFAWIDEAMMQMEWEGKKQWKKNLLQREFYKTSGGGLEFYNKIERLEPEQNDVREVYYLCLVSGFKGMYGPSEEDTFARDAVKSKMLKRLTGTTDAPSVPANDFFFPEGYGDYRNRPESGRKKFRITPVSAMLTAGPVAVFLFLFLLYRFILNNEMTFKLVP